VAQLLAGSEPSAGFILVAFGSSAHFAAQISAEYSQLALALADLAPSKVLWNVRALPHGLTPGGLLGNNTLFAPWVDYNDALGHSNCKAFVTHAGIHSIYEAAFHGVPAVGVPFMDEQLANAMALAGRGMAEVVVEAVGFRKKGRAGFGRQYTRQYMAALIKQASGAGYCCRPLKDVGMANA
jgi:UDP:flavonoid glycosyltransferase YjiC (YdhE family)